MLVNIQLLRFIAALAVVFTHGYDHLVAANGPEDGIFGFISQFGYAGVDVFFVISGFIIWHTTKKLEGWKDISSFIYKRATRIYTGYWPYMLMACMIFWLAKSDIFVRIDLLKSTLLLTPNINKLILPVSWSLVYELYFYLVFAVLLFLPSNIRKNTVILLFAAVLAIQLWALLVMNLYDPNIFKKAPPLVRFFSSPFCLEFLGGCLLAANYHRLNISCWILLSGAIIFTTAGLYVQEHIIQDSLIKGYYRMWRIALFGSASFMLVWFMLEMEKNGIIIVKNISIVLGNISYSLYLCHTLIFAIIYYTGLQTYVATKSYQELWFFGFTLIIILYSAIHYYSIERPLRYWAIGLIKSKVKP